MLTWHGLISRAPWGSHVSGHRLTTGQTCLYHHSAIHRADIHESNCFSLPLVFERLKVFFIQVQISPTYTIVSSIIFINIDIG